MPKEKLSAVSLNCVRQNKLLFSDLTFEVQAGELLLVQGENGVGKSSLLRLLTGIATPAKGNVFWQDEPIASQKGPYANVLHYLGHANGVKHGLTILEQIQLISQLAHVQISMTQIDHVLSLLQLKNSLHQAIKYLSAGQKRRVGLAKLWLLPKKLWLLDEPLTALDQEMQTVFLTALHHHIQTGGMAVISSHQPILLDTTCVKVLNLSPC